MVDDLCTCFSSCPHVYHRPLAARCPDWNERRPFASFCSEDSSRLNSFLSCLQSPLSFFHSFCTSARSPASFATTIGLAALFLRPPFHLLSAAFASRFESIRPFANPRTASTVRPNGGQNTNDTPNRLPSAFFRLSVRLHSLASSKLRSTAVRQSARQTHEHPAARSLITKHVQAARSRFFALPFVRSVASAVRSPPSVGCWCSQFE